MDNQEKEPISEGGNPSPDSQHIDVTVESPQSEKGQHEETLASAPAQSDKSSKLEPIAVTDAEEVEPVEVEEPVDTVVSVVEAAPSAANNSAEMPVEEEEEVSLGGGDGGETHEPSIQLEEESDMPIEDDEPMDDSEIELDPEEDFVSVLSFYGLDPSLKEALGPASLRGLVSRLNEYQSLKSTTQVLEVNLEQFKHTAQGRVTKLTAELQKLKDDAEASKQDLQQASDASGKDKRKLESAQEEVVQARASVEQMQQQMKQYETDKNNAYELLSSKQSQIVDFSKEIQRLSEANRQLKSKVEEAESGKEDVNSQLMRERLNVSKFQHDLELAQQRGRWSASELQQKTAELQQLRDDKRKETYNLRSRVEKLEQEKDVVTQSRNQTAALLKRIQADHESSMLQVRELEDKVARQEHEYTEELAKKEKIITVLQASSDDRKKRIDAMQKKYDEAAKKVEEDEAAYKAQFEGLQDEIAHRESKIKDLEETVNDLSTANIDTTNVLGSLGGSNGNSNGNATETGNSFSLTASAQKLMKSAGYSLTDIVSETNQLRKSLAREKYARQKAEEELGAVFKELDRRLPLLKSYKEKCVTLEMKQGQFEVLLDNMAKEKSMLRTQLSLSTKKSGELQQQVNQLFQYKSDLQRQLATLLAEITVRDRGEGGALTSEEKEYLDRLLAHEDGTELEDTTDTGRLISERLTTFRDIAELIEKNEQLLTVSRSLGNELENKEDADSGELQRSENEALEKSRQAIVKLQEQLQSSKTQIEAITNSRNMLQQLLEGGGSGSGSGSGSGGVVTASGTSASVYEERISALKSQLADKQAEYGELKKQYDSRTFELNMKLQDMVTEKSKVGLELAKANSTIKLIEEKSKSSEYVKQATQTENSQLKQTLARLQDAQGLLESRSQKLSDDILQARSLQASLETQVNSLNAEKQLWQNNDGRLRAELQQLAEEKSQANKLIVHLQTLDSERQAHFQETVQRLNGSVSGLESELSGLRSKLDKNADDTKQILHSKNADAKSYQSRIDILSKELQSTKDALAAKTKAVAELDKNLVALQAKYDEISALRSSGLRTTAADADPADDSMVAALRQELNRALEDSKLASQNAVEYKEIASSSEKELNSLNETYAQYKQSTQQQIEQGQQQVTQLAAQVEQLQTANVSVRQELDAAQRQYQEQKSVSESKIAELKNAVDAFDKIKGDYEQRISTYTGDLTTKDELLKAANEKVQEAEGRLSETAAGADELKSQISVLQEKISSLENELQAAKAALADSRNSWQAEKAGFEQQQTRDKLRISELDTQNRTLVNQLESSSSYTSTSAEDGDMKGVLAHLHRENDSLSQQLEYSKSEESRLRQSMGINEKELSEVKVQLVEAKEKAATADKYSAMLSEMRKESQMLNVYRENNDSLREQMKSYVSKVEAQEKQLGAVSGQMQAMQEQVSALHSELAAKQQQLEVANSQVEAMTQASQATTQDEQTLTNKVAALEKEKMSWEKSNSQLKLYQSETLRLNGEVSRLKERISSLNAEMRKKVEEGSSGRKEQSPQEVEEYKKKLDAEAEAHKKKVEDESRARLQQQLEAYKKRIRAPSNAKIGEVIEQRWKARSAELDREYEAKVKELENKNKNQGGAGLSDAERKKMLLEFEKEKATMKSEIESKMRKEGDFRSGFLKQRVTTLQNQVKSLTARLGENGSNVRPKTASPALSLPRQPAAKRPPGDQQDPNSKRTKTQ